MGINAQTSVPSFTAGDTLTAANTNLLSNGIPVFAGTATRDAAFGGANEKTLAEGQYAYIEATSTLQVYTGSAWINASPAKVGQVVSTAKTDTFTTSSATYADVTGLSLSITPTATTSKIMLVASVVGGGHSGTTAGYAQFVRDSTAIGIGDTRGTRVRATFPLTILVGTNYVYSLNGSFLDSPATTSAITYKIQIRNEAGGTLYINRSQNDADGVYGGNFISTITAFEVLA
jgi:hypothetical protein